MRPPRWRACDHRFVPEQEADTGTHVIAFESFGVRALVGVSDPRELTCVRGVLPPEWRECSPDSVGRRFALLQDGTGTYRLSADGAPLYQGLEFDIALGLLRDELRADVALRAPEATFLRAGAVAHRGSAVLLPGARFAGKSTLVAALVREGAVYYSDEFAVLDRHGLVHPYAQPLSLAGRHETVESIGGIAGDEPLAVGSVVLTEYRVGADWRPEWLSPQAGLAALLRSAVSMRERPDRTLASVARAVERAIVIQSERGEAASVAPLLLAELDAETTVSRPARA